MSTKTGSVSSALCEAGSSVMVFSSDWCSYCRQALSQLDSAGVAYDVLEAGPFKAELRTLTGKTSVPSVWVKTAGVDGAADGARVGDWMWIGGCNDGVKRWQGVSPLLRNGKLEQLVAAAPTPAQGQQQRQQPCADADADADADDGYSCMYSKKRQTSKAAFVRMPVLEHGDQSKLRTFKLQHPGSCTGMFWRGGPAGLEHRLRKGSVAGQPDWPRNNAVLRGFVHDISPKSVENNHLWLEVIEMTQAGGTAAEPSPDCWMQFEQGGLLLHELANPAA